jgi:hypothetical protein
LTTKRHAVIGDLWPAPLAGLAALALYGRTLAPGLTWSHNGADGGDLLAAALTRGVPHPPGYPLYELILRAALALPGAATNPARTGNWLSAVCAALAVALLADLARRTLPARTGRSAMACVAALAWASTPALWSQAVITEVYTLQALAAVMLLWLLWRWREEVLTGRGGPGAWPWLALTGVALGLGLGNHLSLLLITPGMATWLWSYRAALGRAPRPSAARWAGVLVAFSVGTGLAVYCYLPWAAAAQPPVNWGDPSTPAGFVWLVTARAYGGLVFGVPWTSLPARLGAWAAEALDQFWPWGAALAIWGLWRLDHADHPWWRLTGLTALACSLFALGYNTADAYIYLIPAWAAAALWLPHGLAALADAVAHQVSRIAPGRAPSYEPGEASHLTYHTARVTYIVITLSLLAIPGAAILGHWTEMDLWQDHAAQQFANEALAAAKPDGVILVATDRPTFALWYAIYGLRERTDLIPLNVNLYGYPWYRQILANQHPALARLLAEGSVEPDLGGLIRDLARSYPLYRAEPLALPLAGYGERPAGPLVQLISQDAQPF